jgi:hypothetical protein
VGAGSAAVLAAAPTEPAAAAVAVMVEVGPCSVQIAARRCQ